MRKLFNLFAAALVVLAAVSCEKNEVLPSNNSEGKVVTLKASINNGGTKTSLRGEKGSDDKYPVLWSEWDEISVIQGSSYYTFVLLEGKGETSGTFMYPAEQAPNFNPEENYTAFYPASSVSFNDAEEKVQYTISGTQSYAENSFGPGAMPMAASSTGGTTFIFNNLFGVLKLQLKGADGEKVTSIVITSSNALNGEAQLVEGAIALQGTSDENKKVTLDCSANGGVALNPGTATDFHIALPEGASGLKVLINTNNGSYYKEVPSQDASSNPINAITAGNILKMLELNTTNMAPAYIENGVYLGDGVALPAEMDSEGNPTKYLIWAPVNCGYDATHKYGLQYQWGRKYGQGYDGETPAAVLENDLIISVEAGSDEANKNNYYYKWLDSDSNSEDDYNMWYNNTPEATNTKTQYDPCPEGWRVPTNGELISLIYGLTEDHIQIGQQSNWATISDSNDKHDGLAGLWFYGNEEEPTDSSPKVFFPAAGYRYYIYSTSQFRGFMGNYWSSSRNQVGFAWSLEFSNTFEIDVRSIAIFPNNGCSVRCVKE